MLPFADRLDDAARRLSAPIAGGIDPSPRVLPRSYARRLDASPRSAARAVVEFAERVLDAWAGVLPAVKAQIAFFERLGPAGAFAFERVLRAAKERGFLVIADVKRGDIGTTSEAYAEAFFGNPPSCDRLDAVTLHPYLGQDALRPFEPALASGGGVYVLVRTSNPTAGEFQDLRADGQELYRHVARAVERWGACYRGGSGFSCVGAVVGATYPKELSDLRRLHPTIPFLVPGYGAQGAGPEDVVEAFTEPHRGAVVAAARSLLRGAARAEAEGRPLEEGLRQEAEAMRDALRRALDDRFGRARKK